MGFVSILGFAHRLVEERVQQGDIVIDATVGNGVDTLFLTKLVGARGTVYGFDVQPQALDKAMERIRAEIGGNEAVSDTQECSLDQVRLVCRSHADMESVVPPEYHGRAAAVMFNLGYLPGGDHAVITKPDSTLPALDSSLRMLRKGGIVTIALYSGHEGGEAEAGAVLEWACQLPQQQYQVLSYRFLNQKNNPPYLIAVEKR